MTATNRPDAAPSSAGSPGFPQDEDQLRLRGPLSALWRESQGERPMLAVVLALSFVVGLLETLTISLAVLLLVPMVTGEIAQTPSFRGWTLLPMRQMLVLGTAMVLARWAAAVLNDRLMTGAVMRIVVGVRGRLLHKFLAAGWPAQSQEKSASIQERLFRSALVLTSMLQMSIQVVRNCISLMTILLGAIVANPLGSTIAVAISGGLLLATRPLNRRAQSSSKRGQEEALRGADLVRSSLDSVRELTVFGTAEGAYQPMMEQLTRYERLRRRTILSTMNAGHLYFSAVLLCGWMALIVAQWIETTHFAALGVVALLLLRSLGYSRAVQAGWATVRTSLPIYADFLALEARLEAGAALQVWGTSRPETLDVEFREVAFRYPDGDRDALSDLSLKIPFGSAVAVVGPSGGGKSTLAQLLLALRRPTAGELLIGQVPVQELDREWWTAGAAVVTQENRLLDASLLDNVRFFRSTIGEQKVHEALREVGLDEFVGELPDGLHTQIGEGGQRLSGGQRQRLCIARALAGRPRLLVLDEPTSALDVHSERVVQECLERLRGRCTLVVIAHRLSTIRSCERVIVLQDGRISDSGSPAELEERTSYFSEALELAKVSTQTERRSPS